MVHSVAIMCSQQTILWSFHLGCAHVSGRKVAFCQRGYALFSMFSTCPDSNLFGPLPLVVDQVSTGAIQRHCNVIFSV